MQKPGIRYRLCAPATRVLCTGAGLIRVVDDVSGGPNTKEFAWCVAKKAAISETLIVQSWRDRGKYCQVDDPVSICCAALLHRSAAKNSLGSGSAPVVFGETVNSERAYVCRMILLREEPAKTPKNIWPKRTRHSEVPLFPFTHQPFPTSSAPHTSLFPTPKPSHKLVNPKPRHHEGNR